MKRTLQSFEPAIAFSGTTTVSPGRSTASKELPVSKLSFAPPITEPSARITKGGATDMRARGIHTTLCVFSRLGNMIAKISQRGIVAKSETKYRAYAKCHGLARANIF